MSNRYKYNPKSQKNSAGGLSKIDDFYRVFARVRARCSHPSNKDYKRYGAKGIDFAWKSYPDFKADMYEEYLAHIAKHGRKNTTLERLDNKKGYSRENCKWATWEEQYRNKSTNRYLTHKGKTMILADWARELNVSRQAIRYRLEAGWTDEEIIETPFSYANRKVGNVIVDLCKKK